MSGIRKSFSGIEVLHGVDLHVRPGEIHGLIGHNGAGKSTLMRVVGGVYLDYEGSVELGGKAIEVRTPKQALAHGIAIVYQDFSLIPDLDVAHNIALGREPTWAGGRLIDHRALARRSAAEAEAFGMRLPMRTPVRFLGVAAQQQTEIVRALARDARVLIMDEPTARLAPRERENLFATMRELAGRGMSIIYISHFLDEVAEVTDAITVLRDGRVAAGLTTGGHRPDPEGSASGVPQRQGRRDRGDRGTGRLGPYPAGACDRRRRLVDRIGGSGRTSPAPPFAHPVLGPGRLGEARIWCELGADAYPDGMCFTASGRLIVAGTGSGALFVVGPGGQLEERIAMEDIDVTNVCFGGEDERSLYVTEASLGRIVVMDWSEPGAPLRV